MQATCVSETRVYLYVSYKTAHAASDDLSFPFFMTKFTTTQDFSIESTAFTLMPRDVSAIETICNFYTGITWTIKSNQVRKDI